MSKITYEQAGQRWFIAVDNGDRFGPFSSEDTAREWWGNQANKQRYNVTPEKRTIIARNQEILDQIIKEQNHD
tara:strand:+ start:293 stop:511 length:219 start_codon:yes stop_codon:yes gene_type:complete